MSTMIDTHSSMSTQVRKTGPIAGHRAGRIAGVSYAGAWVMGLAFFELGPGADASDAAIAAFVSDHRMDTALQSLLVHGVAAVALGALLVVLARRGLTTCGARVAGAAAVGLSFVQMGLGMYRSLVASGPETATIVHTIGRIDGVKMLALAAVVAAGSPMIARGAGDHRWIVPFGRVVAATLVISGVAYVAVLSSLVASAVVSLVLLIAWVVTAGFIADRTAV